MGVLTRKLPLSCMGVDANFLVEPSPINFPRDLRVGQPRDLAVSFKNQSGGSVTVTDVTLEDTNEITITGTPMGTVVADGATAQILLHYAAETEQAFGRVNRLTIVANGASRTAAINAEALVADIGISPPSVEFGPVCVGAPKSTGVQLYTTASASVLFQSITQPAAPFAVDGMMGELVGNHGNIVDLTATVTPTAAGELSDKFVINTDAAPREISISAIALPMGVATTPTEVHFGASKLNALTTGKSVVVSNCQAAEHTVTSAVITGKDAAQFTIVSPANPLQKIAMASSLEFLVVMRPTSSGAKVAALEVTLDDGSMVTAALDGSGLESDEKTTYYTCSTGGGGGASLPVGLALLALVRRRRTP